MDQSSSNSPHDMDMDIDDTPINQQQYSANFIHNQNLNQNTPPPPPPKSPPPPPPPSESAHLQTQPLPPPHHSPTLPPHPAHLLHHPYYAYPPPTSPTTPPVSLAAAHYDYYRNQQQFYRQQVVAQQQASSAASNAAATQMIVVQEVSKIWVGNLPIDVNEEEIRIFFSPYGKIESIKIDGRCAFIKYTEHDFADNAIKATNGTYFKSNRIKSNWASIKSFAKMPGLLPTTPLPTPIPPPPPPSPPSESTSTSITASASATATSSTTPTTTSPKVTTPAQIPTPPPPPPSPPHQPNSSTTVITPPSLSPPLRNTSLPTSSPPILSTSRPATLPVPTSYDNHSYYSSYHTHNDLNDYELNDPYKKSQTLSYPPFDLLLLEEKNQLNYILDHLTSTYKSIREAKDWILLHFRCGKSIMSIVLQCFQDTRTTPYLKLSLFYLLHDLLCFGLIRRRQVDQQDAVSDLIEPYLSAIFKSTQDQAPIIQQIQLLLDIWESKRIYSTKLIQSLKLYLI